MAQTTFLPGFGIIEDDESGNVVFLPGFGVVEFNAATQPLNLNRISSMHFMRHYEPIAMGE